MMEKLVDVVMRNLEKASPAKCYARECVQQRLQTMFPVFETPDHPPYSLMIEQAIAKLNEEGGSSEESISKCVALEYDHLPWAHTSLLRHHLRKLRYRGEIIYTCDDRYMLPFDNGKGSDPTPTTKKKFKKGCGRRRGIHIQNKKSRRDTLMGSQNTETEHKTEGPEINDVFYQGETSQLEMPINPRDLELSTEENTGVEGNERGSLSQCPQYQDTGEANQAAEKINDEPMVEQVQGSDEHYTTAEQLPVEQKLHVADHDESDEQSFQQHDAILTKQDQVETQPLSTEYIEQSRRADSKSSGRITELPRQREADDFYVRSDSTENQNKVIKGQSEKTKLLEMLSQQIFLRQNEIGDLVRRLKQLTEAPENYVIPYDNVVEVLRRNKEIELVLLEMRNTSPKSSNRVVNQNPHEGKVGVPSKDLSTIGGGAPIVRFPLRRCQQQDNFVQALGTASCAEHLPLYLNSGLRHWDVAVKASGDLSSGEQKQPELSNQQTQSREQCILQQRTGDKIRGSSLSCVVALPVPERQEKLLKQQLPHQGPGQPLPLQGLLPGLNSRNNEVLPSVSIEESACPDESVLQRSDCLEQGLESAKFHNRQDGSVKDCSFCAEQMEEYPAPLKVHGDLNHDHPVGSEELSRMESQQTTTERMTKTRDDFFSSAQAYSALQTPEQPRKDEIARNDTILIAMNPRLPASLTFTELLTEKHYSERDKSNINSKYREKLRSQNLCTDLIPTNPSFVEAKESPPLAIHLSPAMELQHPLPGMLPKRNADALTSGNTSPTPVSKKRKGRPSKPRLALSTVTKTDPPQ